MAVNYNVPVEGIAGELTRRIDAARAGDSPIVVGIDGPGGAGKTTLAESLADTLKRCLIVPTDDFRRPPEGRIRRFLEVCDPGWDYDLERLRDQVLEPARRGLAVRWQRFDWQADRLGVWVDRPAAPVVLVEGVFALHTVLRDYCGFKVWVGASRPLRLQRMVARGHGWPLAQYLLWITEEDRYLEVQHPDEAADVVLNSGGFASVEDAIAAAQTLA